MKRPRFDKAKVIFQRTLHRAPGLLKSRQEFLSRALADIRRKEYVVFVEPALRRVKNTFKTGAAAGEATQAPPFLAPASTPGSSLETVSDPASEQDSPPIISPFLGQAGGGSVDPRFVEEVFGRPESALVPPGEGAELGQPDAEPVPPVTASIESSQGSSPESSGEPDGVAPESGSVAENSPVEPTEATAEATGTPDTKNPGTAPARKANGPMMRTMVETLPDGPLEGSELEDFLSGDLQDIFNTASHSNPRTKALLRGQERVDIRELAAGLKEFAQSIGAVSPDPKKS